MYGLVNMYGARGLLRFEPIVQKRCKLRAGL